MKKFSFISIVLALVLALGFVSCDNDTTSGGNTPGGNTPSGGASTFTLTNIPSQYNGKYAFVQAQSATVQSILGYQSVNWSTGDVTLVPISNGRASIPLFGETGFAYTGTEAVHVAVVIYDQRIVSASTEGNYIAAVQFMNVPFTNGSATKSWADGTTQ
jgi:hypothetical protein